MTFEESLVWETEGRRGAAERGWLGEEERRIEENRQLRERFEWDDWQAEEEATDAGLS